MNAPTNSLEPDQSKVLSTRAGFILFFSIVLAFAAVIFGTKQLFQIRVPDRFNGFSVSVTNDVAAQEIERAIDLGAVRPLDEPSAFTPQEAEEYWKSARMRGKFLVPSDRIAAVTINGETRGYPLRVLVFHEVINDVLGGVPIAVVHHPVSDLVAVFEREIAGEVLQFGPSGLLLDSHILVYDRPPENDLKRLHECSLWSPLLGVALSGPKKTTPLRVLPLEVTTMGDFRTRFPGASLPKPPVAYLKQYRKDPYTAYVGTGSPRFRADPLPDREERALFTPMLIVGTSSNTQAYAIPELIEEAGPQSPHLIKKQGEQSLQFRIVDREQGVVTVSSLNQPLTSVQQIYWFAWYALDDLQPESLIDR